MPLPSDHEADRVIVAAQGVHGELPGQLVLRPGSAVAQRDEAMGDDPYFASFSSCYALLSEIPMEELLATARAVGVATEGRSKLELAKILFSAASGGRV